MDRGKVFSSMVWRFAERIGVEAVAFIVNVILARLLMPEDYGIVALSTVFIVVLGTVADSGLGSALVQREKVDEEDLSSAFWFHLAFGAGLAILLSIAAPLIAAFYRQPSLTGIIRALSLLLVLSGFRAVPEALIVRELRMKVFFFSTLGGTLLSAVVGIRMAYAGWGVWALVAQHLTNTAMDSLILCGVCGWRPRRIFVWGRVRDLVSFGWKIMAASLADLVYHNLRQLLIGRFYPPAALGYYNRGDQLPNVVTIAVNAPLQSSLYPVLAKAQQDPPRMREMLRRSVENAAYVCAPLMAGLAAVAPFVVRLLLTEKWMPAVPFIRVFCLYYLLFPILECDHNAVKALGRSGLFLRMDLAKKGVGLALLAATLPFGALAVCLGLIPYQLFCLAVDGYYSGKLLGFGLMDHLRAMAFPVVLSLVMGAVVSLAGILLGGPAKVQGTAGGWIGGALPGSEMGDAAVLAIQVALGIAVYLGGSAVFKPEGYSYLTDLIKRSIGLRE